MFKKTFTIITIALSASGCMRQTGDDTNSPNKASIPVEKSNSIAAETAPKKAPEPQKTWEGPFGTKMGITKDELSQSIELKPGKTPLFFISETAPTPHQSFDKYVYRISETTGLCKVAALGVDIQTNSFGTEVKEKYKSLKAALTEKYGNHGENFDFLLPRSIWNEPRDWMMSVLKKDRSLATYWSYDPEKKGKNNLPLPHNLTGISIEVIATSTDVGRVDLTYEFSNIDTCITEAKKEMHKSL